MGCEAREREQGFLLVGLIVAIFLILLALSVAAPKVARGLRREREVETVRRGNQYVRAIQLYYRKFGHYPGSMQQLEQTNNIRFLRKQYVDPMTGKADWRLIKVGEAKTTVKGFFGQPLAGLPAGGLGSPGGTAPPGAAGAAGTSGTSAFGASGSSGSPGSSGSMSGGGGSTPAFTLGVSSSSQPDSTSGASGMGSSGGPTGGGPSSAGGSSFGSSGTGSSGGLSALNGGGAPFVGVGLVKEGDSVITLNEQTTYNTWEFIYDPRIEQLKAKAGLLGGGATGTGLGSGSSSPFGTSSPGGSNNNPGNSGSSFGGSNSSGGFGSTPSPASNGNGSTGMTPPPQ